jgi:transcription elongation factor Elf1
MMTVEEVRIDCPRCKIFVTRVKAAEAEVEVNCSRCRQTVVVKVVEGKLTVELVSKPKQQAI